MGNFQTDRVIQILLPLFQGLSGQPVYQVDAYVLDAVFFAKPDCAQSLFAVMAPVQETEVFFFETLYSHTDPVEGQVAERSDVFRCHIVRIGFQRNFCA